MAKRGWHYPQPAAGHGRVSLLQPAVKNGGITGTSESFNGKFRDECLAMNWFYTRTHSRITNEAWRKHYNEVRPHSSLGYKTPIELMCE